MIELTHKQIAAALAGVKRPDYLAIVTPNGEPAYFPADRVRRALDATRPKRMGAAIHFFEKHLVFSWGDNGRLALIPGPGRYVNKRSGRRTTQEWKPFAGALSPAILHVGAP